jgi:DNA repair photolyase
MDKEKFHSEVKVRPGALEQLKKDCAKLKGDNRRVLMSFITDPYQQLDDEIGATREAIKIIKGAGLNVEILTKGGHRAIRDFDLLDADDRFATTLTFYWLSDSLRWEPLGAPPVERLEAIQGAKKKGLTTWASMEPVIDPDQTLKLIRQAAPWTDLFKIGKLNHHKHAKTIDWKRFGNDAVELLEKLGAEYYIKNDLRACMESE